MSKPCVTQIVWSLSRGGAEHMVAWLAEGLIDHGWRVRVIAACGGGPMEDVLRRARIPFVIGPRTHAWHERGRTMRFLAHQLATYHTDICHTHLGADVWAGVPALWHGHRPWVATIHSDETGLSFLHRHVKRWMLPRADRVVCVSDHVRDVVRKTYGVPWSNLLTIRMGIPITRHAIRSGHPWHDVVRLLTVGRLVPEKQHVFLIHALAGVRGAWRLDIIGDGPERERLRVHIERLGLSSRVHLAGEREDIPALLVEADLFCLPSEREGLGVAALEAAASGVPMILADLPALREVFDDASAMFLPAHDMQAWRMGVEDSIHHPALALEKARRAHERIAQLCRADDMVDAYIRLYEQLLQRPDASFEKDGIQ